MTGRIVKLGAVALATAIGFAGIAGMVHAQGDVIKERQALMKDQGANMKAMNGILEANGPAADMATAAAKLHEDSLKIPTLFPAGSGEGDTKAKPEIWTDNADFLAKAKTLQDESAMLVTAIAGGDIAAVKAQYEKVGGACGGCHKIYKAK
jgi:cytochrome c556